MSLDAAVCLANVLINDVVSIPASTFVAQYPLLFNSATAVPTHLYTCLKDIWLGSQSASTTNAQWAKFVNATYGLGTSGYTTIDIIPTRILDQADVKLGAKSNTPGAEFAEIYIYFKKTGALNALTDQGKMAKAEARVRRLIDYNYRTNITGMPEIPITSININPQADFKCYWQGIINPINEQNIAALYYVTYTRLFLK